MRIKSTRVIFIVFFTVIFSVITKITLASDACMLFPVSLKEKVNNSSLIIEGKVIASNSYWNKTHTLINTVNQVQIFKIFKGRSVFHTVNIITEGGRVGLEIMEYTSTLTLQAGDEGIFFCETAPLTSFNIPVISDLPTYKVYSSIQGFIQYNPDNLSASEPFNTYTDIVNTLYPEIVSATGTGFRIVTANPLFTPPKQTPKSGGNIINAVPTITSFSPSTITAGTRSILTINGTNFGAARGTGFVEFANGNDGGASFVKPKVNDYRVWNNNQIQVWVPDNSLSNGPAAGTGVIKVTNSDPSTVTSASTLTITYSVINVEFNSTGQYTEDRNGNGLGGYTFQFESSIFALNAPAVAAFTRTMNNWICNTNINWRIGANTAINSASNDGTNVVRFDIGTELPAGVLGRAGSNYSGCFGGGGDTVWSTVDIDVTFNDNPGGLTWQYGPAAPTSSNFDFESVSVHELGHAHHLGHIILSTAVMHYSITNGQSKRVLNATNDIAAGNFVMTKSTAAHGCKPSVMTALTPAASVSITANPGNSICSGTNVTFTATPVNGGDAPAYQWKKNGVNVGTNSTTYTNNALLNNDQITCVMTSNISCATGNPATSNIITMTVNSSVAASVSIAASPAGAICSGTNVTFTATPTNPGTTPVYQWKKGGVNVGTNSTTYSDNTLATGNQITCVMTSNAACVTGSPATSNIITMTVNPNVAASVSIAASPTGAICPGTNVAFTATPTNPGTTPVYQWKKGGVNVGTNSTTYSDNTLATGNQITCVMTSNAACVTGNPATSNIITMTVNPNVAASVSIAASPAGAICSGTNVTFTATPTNPGTTPVYQWKKGGVNVGTNSTTYSDNTLATGNQITCVMTSNAACVTGSPATSNIITMTVNPNVAASVSIAASPAGAICSGTNVTFTATPTNPGTTPVYQWKKGGVNVGTNSTTYSDNALATGNQITCVMTSNATCVTGSPATSNIITMTVNPNLTASVSIAASPAGAICPGTNVTFTATPTNPGTTPVYQWKKGGVNVGTNSTTYSDNSLATGNQITCVMTSNAVCVTGSPATSNIVTMTVNPLPVINNFTPSSGTVGSTVTINGSGFVNVSSVKFNGTSASFTVNSSIQITATVPSGATLGTISVITACGTATSGAAFTVIPSGVTLTVKLFIEGYYNAGGLMNNGGLGGSLFVNAISPNAVDVDTVFISAMDAVSHVLVSRQSGILKTNGNVIVTFNAPVVAGTSYFIRVQHRNALETWSALPVVFAANTSYDFTTAQNKAFGNTQVQTSDINVWAFYSGDISSSISGLGVQDGIMESQDYGDMENAVYSTLTGYKIQDITGDGVVESADYGIMESNVYFTVVVMHP